MMIEATFLLVVLAALVSGAAYVGEVSSARLDAAYASRHIAFSGAMNGCLGVPTTPGGSLKEKSAPPKGSAASEQVTTAGGQGRDVSALFVDFANGGASVTVSTPARASYSSQSWVACVPVNAGKALIGSDFGDPTAMQDQFAAMLELLRSTASGWSGMTLF